MNLILSSKAAQRLQQEVQSREDSIADINAWRIDVLDLRKRGIFLITQEKSLYTLISSYKQGIKGIIAQITAIDRHEGDSPEIHYLKSENRSLVSSMNNMKNLITKLDQYNAVDNERFAEIINQTPFKYLSYRTPAECYQNLLNQSKGVQ
ncbi:MAG: hypothetical protein GPJ21_01395 [Microcystis aeruginosa W13-11]|nr:hypothetical protein [Microcystis aeruginosa W13-11]